MGRARAERFQMCPPIWIRRTLSRPEIVLTLALYLALACQPVEHAESTSNDSAPGVVRLPGLPTDLLGAPTDQTASTGPPPPAPASAVDPFEPWSALGALTGRYEVVVTQIENDCTYGPDVPFDYEMEWIAWYPEPEPEPPTVPLTGTYYTNLTQRGDAVVFELGEGVVLARWSATAGRLTEVERIGAEGVTFYLDGFDAGPVSETDDRLLIAGESEWEFHDEYWEPGEICRGRATWELLRLYDPPVSGSRDLHFVLRWPAESRADLDLMIREPDDRDSFTQEYYSHFANVEASCYQLHAAGYAVADEGDEEAVGGPASGFFAALGDTALPYHEEIIRCAYASYGYWEIGVVNWNAVEDVDFEIEVFVGRGLNTGGPQERSFGANSDAVAPLTMATAYFQLSPPTTPGGAYGIIIVSRDRPPRTPVARPLDPITDTPLGFNKAAYEGFTYAEFLAALGLEDPS
jgi:hypothetical protein